MIVCLYILKLAVHVVHGLNRYQELVSDHFLVFISMIYAPFYESFFHRIVWLGLFPAFHF